MEQILNEEVKLPCSLCESELKYEKDFETNRMIIHGALIMFDKIPHSEIALCESCLTSFQNLDRQKAKELRDELVNEPNRANFPSIIRRKLQC